MREKLHLRILASLAGAILGYFFLAIVYIALTELTGNVRLQESLPGTIWNTSVGFAQGFVLLTIVNICDTYAEKPRQYWFFGLHYSVNLAINECFVFGLFAFAYPAVMVLNYIFEVLNRSTNM